MHEEDDLIPAVVDGIVRDEGTVIMLSGTEQESGDTVWIVVDHRTAVPILREMWSGGGSALVRCSPSTIWMRWPSDEEM